MFISFLYTFRATVCPSSGETAMFMRHLVFVIVDDWMTVWCAGWNKKYINTAVSSDHGLIVARNM